MVRNKKIRADGKDFIPNQRIDRLSKFVKDLDEKLSKLDIDFVNEQLKNEHFTDLLEEAIKQSTRALTPERRAYIASVIENGLKSNEVDYLETKKLLIILESL